MYQKPIDERYLLTSIPGFSELTPEEKLHFRIDSFEYDDKPLLSTVTLKFLYKDFIMSYEASFSREKGFCYEHVMYGDEEFPDFRHAIDYCER